ncbi:hypothetical protein AVEN_154415-1 [Araneus ventricosus]|uniref:Uncharacterized protein n=1 Tax=Araneus ventricosus TaxID=182803 RepID=A0A4Y2SF80_ARAVE|nr:hypothetical protein AVEN_154415-1 [Araneus ventricosus]
MGTIIRGPQFSICCRGGRSFWSTVWPRLGQGVLDGISICRIPPSGCGGTSNMRMRISSEILLTCRKSKQSLASWWDIVMVVWLLRSTSEDGSYPCKREGVAS